MPSARLDSIIRILEATPRQLQHGSWFSNDLTFAPSDGRSIMNRRAVLALTRALFGSGVALLAGNGIGRAQQSDTDDIKATIDGFYAALTALDIGKLDDVWAHDSYVTAINPGDKTISIGWDAVRKKFQEQVFSFWTELKVTQRDTPFIHVNGGTGWANGVAVATGKSKSGVRLTTATFETGILEKRGDQWLIVSWSAWRIPR
jgi:ketosteroid isomerase-like protein